MSALRLRKSLGIIVAVAVMATVFGVASQPVRAAADIVINTATYTSSNTVAVTFVNPGQNLASVDATKWHIDQNGGGSSPLTPTSAVVTTAATPWKITLTFSGTPFSAKNTSSTAALGLYADASAVTDTNGDTNAVVANSSSIAITDGQAPTLSSVGIASDNGYSASYAKTGDVVTVTFTATEPVRTPVVTINGDAAGVATTTGNTFIATSTMSSGYSEGAVTFNIAVTDLVGNAGTAVTAVTDASSVTFDKTVPTVAISSTATSPTQVSPIPVTVTFSEDVTGFTSDDVTTSNGTVSNFVAQSGTVYTFDVTPVERNVVTVDVAAASAIDVANNDNTAASRFSIVYAHPSSLGGSGGGHRTKPVVAVEPLATAPATVSVTTPTPSVVLGNPATVTEIKKIAANLSVGASNASVKALQQFLNAHGFMIATSGAGSAGHETNLFGAKTRAALAKFQASIGIKPATGNFGPKTRAYFQGL